MSTYNYRRTPDILDGHPQSRILSLFDQPVKGPTKTLTKVEYEAKEAKDQFMVLTKICLKSFSTVPLKTHANPYSTVLSSELAS